MRHREPKHTVTNRRTVKRAELRGAAEREFVSFGHRGVLGEHGFRLPGRFCAVLSALTLQSGNLRRVRADQSAGAAPCGVPDSAGVGGRCATFPHRWADGSLGECVDHGDAVDFGCCRRGAWIYGELLGDAAPDRL